MVCNIVDEPLTTPPTKTWASLFQKKPDGTAVPAGQNVNEAQVVRDPAMATQSEDPDSSKMRDILTRYRLDNRPAAVLPRGLTNRSNFCYVNSVLQALIACTPFFNMLKALPYRRNRGKSSTPVIDSLVDLCTEYGSAASSTGSGHGSSAVTGPPLDGLAGLRVQRNLPQFSGSMRQEDAEEFLSCLLNSVDDEMLEVMKSKEPEGPKRNTEGKPNAFVSQNKPAWVARHTPLADIFRGHTRSRLHRSAQHRVTETVQPFFTLQLDIERSSTVQHALELMAAKEKIEGIPDAWQQLKLDEPPAVLILHTKCFRVDASGRARKIVKMINFPIDLELHPKIMSSKYKCSQQRSYKLFAVVHHEGADAVRGHYVTDAFNSRSGWMRFNDATVNKITAAQVLKATPYRMPYLLMYRRQDTFRSV